MKKRAEINSREILIIGIISLIFCLTFVSAASTMTAPVSYGNYTSPLTFTVIYDGRNPQNMTNVTCYYNSTGGVANVFALNITNTTSYQTTFTGTAVLTTESNLYNITCLLQNGSSADGFTTNASFYATNITIDNTYPLISIVSPANNTNSSDNTLDINYTFTELNPSTCWYSNDSMATNTTLASCGTNITDITWTEGKHNVTIWVNDSAGNVNFSYVAFTITPAISIVSPANNINSTNINLNVNYTVSGQKFCWYSNDSMTANTTLASCTNITITWSEGRHNVTIWANNSAGNVNFSYVAFTIDITAPTITFNCSKTRFSEGESIGSCPCTATDNYDSNPTVSADQQVTTNAGTYTVTCTATDNVGNAGSSPITYTVEASGGNVVSGTSGGGTTYTNTFVEDTKEFSEIKEVSRELGTKNRIRIKINNIKHEVGVKALTTSTATIEVSSTPQTAILSIGDTRRFDVTSDDYYDLSVTLNKIANNKASITLKSIYEKVTTETAAPQEQGKEQAAAAAQTQPETGTLETKSNTVVWVIVGIIVVLILVGIGYGIKKKKRR